MNDMTVHAQQRAPATAAGFGSADSFALAQRGAKLLAEAELMPARFRGKIPDCMIVLEMAQRLGANPLQVAQNLYVVHGTPAWSAQFVISCINSSKRFNALRYEIKGDNPRATDYRVRAWTTERGSTEPLYGPWIDWQMVKAEQWDSKSGSKWKTIPDLMFRYRAAAWWGRTYAPELTMGIRTVEEEAEILDVSPRDGTDLMREINAQVTGQPAAVSDEAVPADETPPKTYEAMLAAAETHEQIDLVRDMLDDVADDDERKRLLALASARAEAIGE